MGQTRRKFLNFLLSITGIGALGAILYPVFSYLVPPKIAEANVNSVKVGKVMHFPPDSSKILKFGREPVIVVRDKQGEFHALSAVCTHLQCIVQFRTDKESIWCACHNGLYDLKGRNISGPPPKPLKEFKVNIVNDELIISKMG